jgi:hypothetical protein
MSLIAAQRPVAPTGWVFRGPQRDVGQLPVVAAAHPR